ncbi:hypothetical protein [Desulfobacter sp.]|jgi:translation initiation factor IF-3|nr:hypothetical protein [Desulfobacter sp.]MBP8828717.1 hypothetical protein [Desulfobacter sp.]
MEQEKTKQTQKKSQQTTTQKEKPTKNDIQFDDFDLKPDSNLEPEI